MQTETRAIWAYRVLPAVILSIVLLAPLGDYDTWFYLDMGRWMLEHGTYLDRELRTYTSQGAHINNVSWLFQLLVATGERWAGLYGLLALQATLFFLTLLGLASVAIKRASDGVPWLCALAFLVPLFQVHYSLRPHLVEHICLAGVLLIFRMPAGWKKLAASIALLLVWANTHGSSPVGAAALALHWLADADSRRAIPVWQKRLALSGLFMLVPLMSPMGLDLLDLLTQTRADNAVLGISEWSRPAPYPQILYLVVAGYLVALLARASPVLVGELFLIVFYFYYSTQHVRFLKELAILSVVPATYFIAILRARIEPVWQKLAPMLLISLALVFLSLNTPSLSHLHKLEYAYPINEGRLPVSTTGLIARLAAGTSRPLRILNPYEWGGYMASVLGDKVRIHVDGRASMVFDNQLVRENFIAYNKHSRLLKTIAEKWQVDLIITHRPDQIENLEIAWEDEDWRLIGYDGASMLYAKRGGAAARAAVDWPEVDYFPGSLTVTLPTEKLPDAIAATQQLLDIQPDNPWAWAHLGALQHRRSLGLKDGRSMAASAVQAWRKAWNGLRTPEVLVGMLLSMQQADVSPQEVKEWLARLPSELPASDPPYLETRIAKIYLDMAMPAKVLQVLSPADIFRRDKLDAIPMTWYLRASAMSMMNDEVGAARAVEKGMLTVKSGEWPPQF